MVLTGASGHGRRAAAGGRHGRASCLAVESDETRIDFRLRTRYVDEKAKTLDEALALIERWTQAGEAKSVGLLGNAAEIFPEILRRMQAGGSARTSSPTRPRRTTR